MERIKLSSREKKILKQLSAGKYPMDVMKQDKMPIKKLIYDELVSCKETEFGDMLVPELTRKGELYMYDNPKLKNPSILQDKGFVLSVIAIIISIISLFVKQ